MKLSLTIITPVFNNVHLLKETLQSIESQFSEDIEYIIIDGDSNDGTKELIAEYGHIVTKVISEKDHGMYDALVKGLLISSGDIICYLNAGDIFYNHTTELVVKLFSENDIQWVTAYRTLCNENNVITKVDAPFRYKSNLIEKGVYGKWLPYIQQESTFWRRDLNKYVNLEELRTLNIAGDYYLWYCFSKYASLEVVKSPLGVFKIHDGQLSENLILYWNEVDSFVSKKSILTILQVIYEAFFWLVDVRIREKLVKNVWKFDFKINRWRRG